MRFFVGVFVVVFFFFCILLCALDNVFSFPFFILRKIDLNYSSVWNGIWFVFLLISQTTAPSLYQSETVAFSSRWILIHHTHFSRPQAEVCNRCLRFGSKLRCRRWSTQSRESQSWMNSVWSVMNLMCFKMDQCSGWVSKTCACGTNQGIHW